MTTTLCIVVVVATVLLLILTAVVGLWQRPKFRRSRPDGAADIVSVGFFHPYCSSGGGGERVLWKIVQVLRAFRVRIFIYTIDAYREGYRDGEEREGTTVNCVFVIVERKRQTETLCVC